MRRSLDWTALDIGHSGSQRGKLESEPSTTSCNLGLANGGGLGSRLGSDGAAKKKK